MPRPELADSAHSLAAGSSGLCRSPAAAGTHRWWPRCGGSRQGVWSGWILDIFGDQPTRLADQLDVGVRETSRWLHRTEEPAHVGCGQCWWGLTSSLCFGTRELAVWVGEWGSWCTCGRPGFPVETGNGHHRGGRCCSSCSCCLACGLGAGGGARGAQGHVGVGCGAWCRHGHGCPCMVAPLLSGGVCGCLLWAQVGVGKPGGGWGGSVPVEPAPAERTVLPARSAGEREVSGWVLINWRPVHGVAHRPHVLTASP